MRMCSGDKMAAPELLNVKTSSEQTNDGHIGAMLMKMGFLPNTEFITIRPLSRPQRFQLQLRTVEVVERIEASLELKENEEIKKYIQIARPTRTILVTRVFGTVTNGELEDQLFPLEPGRKRYWKEKWSR